MIVKCEQCQTRFKIPDDKVTDKGVKVRCTKCGHTFRVTRDMAQPASPVREGPAPGASDDPFARFGAPAEPTSRDETRPGLFGLGVEASRSSDFGSEGPTVVAASTLGGKGFDFGSLIPPRPAAPPAAVAPAPASTGARAMDFSAATAPLPPPEAPPPPPVRQPPPPVASTQGFDFSSLGSPPVPAQAPVPSAPSPFDFMDPAPSPAAPKGYDFGGAPSAPAPGGYDFGGAPPAPAPGGYDFGGAPPAPAPGGYDFGGAPSAPAPGGYDFGGAPPVPAPGGYDFGGAPPAPAPGGYDLGGEVPPAAPGPFGFAAAAPSGLPSSPAPRSSAPLDDLGSGQESSAETSTGSPDDFFGAPLGASPAPSQDAGGLAAPVATLPEVPPAPSAPEAAPAGVVAPAPRVAAAPAPVADAPRSRRTALGIVVNLAIAAVLAVGLLVVGTAYLNDGKVTTQTFSLEGLKNTFAPTAELLATDLSNGLYETRADRAVFYVRGDVTNRGQRAVKVVVTAELVEGERVVRSAEGWAGQPPTPEELHQVKDAESLEALSARVAQRAGPVPPGGTAPFVVTFTEYPPDLKGFRVRVLARAVPERAAAAP